MNFDQLTLFVVKLEGQGTGVMTGYSLEQSVREWNVPSLLALAEPVETG